MESDSYNPKKALWALLSDDAKKLFDNATTSPNCFIAGGSKWCPGNARRRVP
jgi:hypothetical protein